MASQQEQTTSQEGSGLSHSTPLVTIPNVHGSGITLASSTDHPLAHTLSTSTTTSASSVSSSAAAVVTATMDVELSEQRGSAPPQQVATAAPSSSVQNPPFPATSPPPPTSVVLPKIINAPVSPTAKTLDDLADSFLSGTSARIDQGLQPIIRPPPLPTEGYSDLERLRVLVSRRASADIVSLAAQLIRGPSSHYAPIYAALNTVNNNQDDNNNNNIMPLMTLESQQEELVEILTIQCHALLKMRRYSELKHEIERWTFCRLPDIIASSSASSSSSRPAWVVPWSLHILAASTLQYTSVEEDSGGSISNDKGASAAADALWKIRAAIPPDDLASILQVEQALSNVFLRQKQWRMALQCLQRMMDLLPAACQEEATKLVKKKNEEQAKGAALLLETAYRCELLSRQGRILLQVGAVPEASQIFEEAKSSWSDIDSTTASAAANDEALADHADVQLVPAQLAVNEGLLCFAYEKYDEALEFFRRAVNLIRKTMTTTTSTTYRTQDWVSGSSLLVGMESRHALYSETMNNMALCAIYTCRLQEGVHLIESLVREDPTSFLTERVALNLCTLYELGSDTAVSARKKRVMQLIAKRFFLHDIGSESFRLS